MNHAYLGQRAEQISGTRALVAHYRKFIRSGFTRMEKPGERGFFLDRDEAQRELTKLVNVAVNRKAGLPDQRGRKDSYEYHTLLVRDARRLQDMASRIRVYQFESPECRARFSHKLASRDD